MNCTRRISVHNQSTTASKYSAPTSTICLTVVRVHQYWNIQNWWFSQQCRLVQLIVSCSAHSWDTIWTPTGLDTFLWSFNKKHSGVHIRKILCHTRQLYFSMLYLCSVCSVCYVFDIHWSAAYYSLSLPSLCRWCESLAVCWRLYSTTLVCVPFDAYLKLAFCKIHVLRKAVWHWKQM